jgi:hypothetical protein
MKVVSPWDTEVHVTWDIKVPGLGKPGTQESQRVLFSSYMSYTLS